MRGKDGQENKEEMIKVKVTKGNKYHFYETEEEIIRCPKCKREYKSRKYCLYCFKKYKKKIETKKVTKQYTGTITTDLQKFSCSCIFGSWFRWGKHWRDNYPNSRCRHAKWATKKIKQKTRTKT